MIVEAGRTPSGAHMGSFRDVPSEKLLAECYKWVIKKSGVDPALIDEVIASNCWVKSSAPNVGHVAWRLANLPQEVPCSTIQQNCGSGTRAIITAAEKILAGGAEIVLVGGTENMSEVPHYVVGARSGRKLGNFTLVDALNEGLSDSLAIDEITKTKALYWQIAENSVKKWKITAENQNRYAVESHRRAYDATQKGIFHPRMIPILNRTVDETIRAKISEQFAGVYPLLEKIFHKEGGTITPFNSSPICDGAGALLVMSESRAKALGLQPLAEIVAYASVGGDPYFMGELPVLAIQKTLTKAGLTAKNIDFLQLNEAFGGQTLACLKQLPFSEEQVNPLGGAIALGHPIGASGIARTVDSITIFENTDAKYIMVAFCIGGGQGIAMLLKRPEMLSIAPRKRTRLIGTVGILGSNGTMGNGIHIWLARQGVPSVRYENTPELTESARKKFEEQIDSYAERGKISASEASNQKSLVNSASSLKDLADCDLIIEAIPENMDLKKEIFRELDRIAKPDAILASNTSSLSITELGAVTKRPNQVVGVHFFNPPKSMRLVEINIGKETSPEIVSSVEQFIRERIQKDPIFVKDSPGFYVNRALAALLLEGVYGISRTEAEPKAIDECMKKFGWPDTGCFWLLDWLGLPLVQDVLSVLYKEFGIRMAIPHLISIMNAEGRKGEKWGAGFYDYGSRENLKSLNEILNIHFPDRAYADPEKIFKLMMYQFVGESVRCLEEGIISLDDIGTGARFGIGFPYERENPLKWADEEGLGKIVEIMDAVRQETGDSRYDAPQMLREYAESGKTFFSSLESLVW